MSKATNRNDEFIIFMFKIKSKQFHVYSLYYDLAIHFQHFLDAKVFQVSTATAFCLFIERNHSFRHTIACIVYTVHTVYVIAIVSLFFVRANKRFNDTPWIDGTVILFYFSSVLFLPFFGFLPLSNHNG